MTGVTGITSMTPAAPTITTADEPPKRNENGKMMRSGGPQVGRAASDWRSRMERMNRQQAQKLMQLHRTIAHLTNLLEAQEARKEAPWRARRNHRHEIESTTMIAIEKRTVAIDS